MCRVRQRVVLIRKADYSELNGWKHYWHIRYDCIAGRLIDTGRGEGEGGRRGSKSSTNERKLKGDLCVLHPGLLQEAISPCFYFGNMLFRSRITVRSCTLEKFQPRNMCTLNDDVQVYTRINCIECNREIVTNTCNKFRNPISMRRHYSEQLAFLKLRLEHSFLSCPFTWAYI